MKSSSQQPELAFVQIVMSFRGVTRFFTYSRYIMEYELQQILDDLIDEMAGLEWAGPIEIVYRYKDGSAKCQCLDFLPIDD